MNQAFAFTYNKDGEKGEVKKLTSPLLINLASYLHNYCRLNKKIAGLTSEFN